jgi:hypothetical protein
VHVLGLYLELHYIRKNAMCFLVPFSGMAREHRGYLSLFNNGSFSVRIKSLWL